MSLSIGEILNDQQELEQRAIENYLNNVRVSIPGFIVDFNAKKQSATIQLALKEKIMGNWEQLPLLLDVPVIFPRAGGYCLTIPVKKGDECIVLFADMCIDAWWQSGNISRQLELRRHDLSDGIALIGITSVPKAVKNYSMESICLRNEDNDTFIEINNNKGINIVSSNDLNIHSTGAISFKSEKSVSISAPVINTTEI